jgi:predicted small metal-binding protein
VRKRKSVKASGEVAEDRFGSATTEEDAMKSFACGDVVPGCDARWVRSSEDELMALVAEHAREAHGLVEVPGELEAQVRAAMLSVA